MGVRRSVPRPRTLGAWQILRRTDPHGRHPDLAGRLPILRPAGPRHLRRKAKNLRNRLTNYFQDLANLHPRTQQMVTTASAVQWTVVRSEVEALTLEFTWIKEFNPRFNVIFKDDKSYPYLAVSMGERFPRVQVTRERKRAGSRYFGPYTQVWAIRETIDQLPARLPDALVFDGRVPSARRRRGALPCSAISTSVRRRAWVACPWRSIASSPRGCASSWRGAPAR